MADTNETNKPEGCQDPKQENCSSCGVQGCPSRNGGAPVDLRAKLNPRSSVKKVIAVVSGKGGVGKSFVTSYLAVLFQKMGKRAAILDADITGPSIPKTFGVTKLAEADDTAILPMHTATGIQMISVNNLLPVEDTPVLWRGPVIGGTVKQFWSDVYWDDVDYMFVDMPPGTGDVALTVFQSLPVDGIIVVTSPQDLVSMIVGKAVNMAKAMNVPVLGLVENYSYFKCPDCGKEHHIFGDSNIDEVAEKYGTKVLAKIPLETDVAETVDSGAIETLDRDYLDGAVREILSL